MAFTVGRSDASAGFFDEGLRRYMLGVYNFMASALAVSGIAACSVSMVPQLAYLIHSTPLAWLFALAPLVIVVFMSAKVHAMSIKTMHICFWSFAISMGVSLSSLFLVYTAGSIAQVFFITASVFGCMSLYGYSTRRDLTSLGMFMMVGVIGLIVASIVNLFLHSSGLTFATSLLGVVIFVGLTAYDVQKIKRLYYEIGSAGGDYVQKMSLMGALTLYMDFVNLMMSLMRLIGRRRD